jgi:hypothetical protein
MKVADLIEQLQAMPGHLPVHVAFPADGSGGGADTDYYYTLDCELSSFPTQGRMAVITLNMEPT